VPIYFCSGSLSAQHHLQRFIDRALPVNANVNTKTALVLPANKIGNTGLIVLDKLNAGSPSAQEDLLQEEIKSSDNTSKCPARSVRENV